MKYHSLSCNITKPESLVSHFGEVPHPEFVSSRGLLFPDPILFFHIIIKVKH